MAKKLLWPDDVRALLLRRYENQQRSWLAGEGVWPLSLPLGEPNEKTAAEDAGMVRAWVDAWTTWSDGGEVQWLERRWPRLGPQRLPSRLGVPSAGDVAAFVGEGVRFQRARERYEAITGEWPALSGAALARYFDVLADYAPEDFRRLTLLITWLERNPNSGLYVRQLPIAGMDTKWIEKRRALVSDLVRSLRGAPETADFYELCGLRRPPFRIRIRLLCPRLRRAVGGLGDIEAPLEDLAALDLRPERALIVENLETGLALPELAGCVAFMKLGRSVGLLAGLPWLRDVPAWYWGDLDTHGLVILDHARAALSSLRSVLMDEATLLAHRALWVQEPTPHPEADLPRLTSAERALFAQLRANAWGQGVRLEQERIPWPEALHALRARLE